MSQNAIILSDYTANIPVKPGKPRRGGKKGRREGREGWDVMAIMKWVHIAWNGCIIGNPSYAG